MRSKKAIPAICLFLAGLMSCSTEFDPLIEATPVPVVYSLFNYPDTIHWVRVTKSFQLRTALTTANIPEDSLAYPDARVMLEKWHDDNFMGRAVLTRQDWLRDSGLFPGNPNLVYFLKQLPDNNVLFAEPYPGDVIKLIVDIPDLPVVFSEINPVKCPPIEYLGKDGEKIELYGRDPNFPFKITWKSLEYYQEMYLEVHYIDHYKDLTVPRTVIWREYHSIPPPDPEFPRTGVLVTGTQMMQRIAANIREDTAVMARTFGRVVIRLHFTDNRLYTYNLAYGIVQDDRAGTGFSNIINGLGLFGATSNTQRWFTFGYRTADSLAKGQYTRHLRFRND